MSDLDKTTVSSSGEGALVVGIDLGGSTGTSGGGIGTLPMDGAGVVVILFTIIPTIPGACGAEVVGESSNTSVSLINVEFTGSFTTGVSSVKFTASGVITSLGGNVALVMGAKGAAVVLITIGGGGACVVVGGGGGA